MANDKQMSVNGVQSGISKMSDKGTAFCLTFMARFSFEAFRQCCFKQL